MSDPNTADGAATGADGANNEQQQSADQKPTETVEFWKAKAREWETKSKANKTAADELAQIREAQKTDEQKRAEREASLQAEVDSVPKKVAEGLRTHLIALHNIDSDDAELFLTGDTPELLMKQVTRLTEQSGKRKGNFVPREGNSSKPSESEETTFVRELFGGGD